MAPTRVSTWYLLLVDSCSAGKFRNQLGVANRGHGAWRFIMTVLVLGTDLIASKRAPDVAIVVPLPTSLQVTTTQGRSFVPASLAVVAFAQLCLTAPGFSTGATSWRQSYKWPARRR